MRDFLKNTYYYGKGDYLSHIFLKDVCQNIDYLEQNLQMMVERINSIEDLYAFMWFNAFKKIVKDIDCYKLENNYKQRVILLANNTSDSKGRFVEFINANYKDVFNETKHIGLKWSEFFLSAIELIYCVYSKSINVEVFLFLETNYPLHLLSHFEICGKYYLKHRKNLESLFNELESTSFLDEQVYLKFLINNQKTSDEFYKQKASFICKRAIERIKAIKISEDSYELLELQSILMDYRKLAILYNLPCSNEYNKLKSDIESLLNRFIRKHGVCYQTKIDDETFKKGINILKDSKDEMKFIGLTHHKDQQGQVSNILNEIFKVTNKNNPLSEVGRDIARNRSDKYPYYRQDNMRVNMHVRSVVIGYIFNDEQLLGEFTNYVYNISLIVQEKYFNSLIDIEKEISGSLDVFFNILKLAKDKQYETTYGSALTYGLSLTVCSTIEKILRNVVLKEEKNKKFIDVDKITLANILGYKLTDVSDGLKYHLEFYLIKELNGDILEMDRPGLNIRNNIMHGRDEAYAQTNYETCLNLFYFLLSLLNDLFLITMDENN